jgi:hypothetical protein
MRSPGLAGHGTAPHPAPAPSHSGGHAQAGGRAMQGIVRQHRATAAACRRRRWRCPPSSVAWRSARRAGCRCTAPNTCSTSRPTRASAPNAPRSSRSAWPRSRGLVALERRDAAHPAGRVDRPGLRSAGHAAALRPRGAGALPPSNPQSTPGIKPFSPGARGVELPGMAGPHPAPPGTQSARHVGIPVGAPTRTTCLPFLPRP